MEYQDLCVTLKDGGLWQIGFDEMIFSQDGLRKRQPYLA